MNAVSGGNSFEVSISVVVFRPDRTLLARTLASLAAASDALAAGKEQAFHLYLIDNGGLPDMGESLETLERAGVGHTLIEGHGNVGYGRGHNLAITQPLGRYHLILNPDIDMNPDALAMAIEFMESHPDAGLLTPAIFDDKGEMQFLCRQYPTLIDLFVRGFLPASTRRPFARRLARYEMRAQINGSDTVWDPPIVSGCFMLFRSDVLEKLEGFDPRYFLYFEDYDLSLRAHDVARVVYVPAVRVLHHGGGASRKGFEHIRMFAASAFKFFNRFGWKWL
ncbi:glycosyltransferase family 2 protein [Paraburkholderia tagetis]|uniref:Glycosyltransferase family 2 protein n=1 Tax=Paraburkholderia tagetis TaxID=2913261 RepID=A0A9X1RSK5_9BURK|nr:glycosyltransferase family 2 protein [Paraburkholderia tagetis]MCG5075216.1 glycosyltransferase family 2 protein [Paraburkholderia tagetis]